MKISASFSVTGHSYRGKALEFMHAEEYLHSPESLNLVRPSPFSKSIKSQLQAEQRCLETQEKIGPPAVFPAMAYWDHSCSTAEQGR